MSKHCTDCFSTVCGDRTQHVMGTCALQNIIITPLHDFMNLLRFNNATLTLARTVTASPRHCHYCGHGGVPSPDFQSTTTKERSFLSASHTRIHYGSGFSRFTSSDCNLKFERKKTENFYKSMDLPPTAPLSLADAWD